MVTDPSAKHVSQVTVQVQLADKLLGGHRFFQVNWRIHGKDGGSGSIFVLNSYSEPREYEISQSRLLILSIQLMGGVGRSPCRSGGLKPKLVKAASNLPDITM